MTIQTQGKRLEKLTEALSEMESQQYQKDATIKAQKGEHKYTLVNEEKNPLTKILIEQD